jgi:hypothetical protein
MEPSDWDRGEMRIYENAIFRIVLCGSLFSVIGGG